jgi:hypothetical protein
MKKLGHPKTQGARKQRSPMRKEATLKRKGSKIKTSDEKRGNPKTQWAPKQRPHTKKEATPKCKGLKKQIK